MNRLRQKRQGPGNRARLKQAIEALRPRELKATYTTTSGTTTTAGAVTYITTLAQGDDIGNRTGDCIRVRELEVRVAAINTVSSISRYIIFSDEFCQGVAPGVSDVLTVANYNSLYDLRLVLQAHRFKILWDSTLVHNVAGEAQKFASGLIKFGGAGKLVNFLSSGSTVAAAGHGNLFLLTIGKDITTTLQVDTRINFCDE